MAAANLAIALGSGRSLAGPPPSSELAPSVRLAVLGGIADPVRPRDVAAVVDDVAGWKPDAVVWTGSGVRRSTRSAWGQADVALAELAGTPFLAVPGPGEHRGDPRLKQFRSRFVGDRWWTRDLEVEGQIWRVLAVDADPDGPLVEEAFWLPKVAGPAAHYDHLVVLIGTPTRSTIPGTVDSASRDLVELASECSDGRLRLVLAGGTWTNELFLPSSAWGEAVVDAGNAGVSGPVLGAEELDGQEAGFAMAIRLSRERTDSPDGPVAGWWALELQRSALVLTFQRLGPDGVIPVARAHWTSVAGWSVRPLEPVAE